MTSETQPPSADTTSHERVRTPGDRTGNPAEGGFLVAERSEDVVAGLVEIRGLEALPNGALFTGPARAGAAEAFSGAEHRLRDRGFDLTLAEAEGGVAALVLPHHQERLPSKRLWLHVLLLVLTLATTTWAGVLHQGIDLGAEPRRWTAGLPYALALLAVLGVHEMGHYLVARRRGVPVTLPYFIPAPGFLGTFGAFIRMPARVATRAHYFDIAVAGPLAGLAVASMAIFYAVMSGDSLPGHGMDPRSSTFFYLLYRLCGGDPAVERVALGAVGFAGWLGLVVTALNLLPVGQLDGGHIAYSLWGRQRAATVGAVVLGLMVAAGIFASPHLLVWAFVIWALAGRSHPPAANELAPLGTGRHLLGFASFLVLLAILAPWPG